jgi:hypothetical protein
VRRGDGPDGGAGGGGSFAKLPDGRRTSGCCVYGGGGAEGVGFDPEGREVVAVEEEDFRANMPGLPVSPNGVRATFPSRRDLISVSAR